MAVSKAEMHPAYMWDCDECGRENFVRAVVSELSEEEERELREEHGIEPYMRGEWHTYPDNVTCRHCGASFEAYQ